MANTTYFGWETPDDTDLVKDGAAAIRTLGQAIDTSMQDLEGGTTGQILSKNSNTDMDFVWITNDVGDITAVNVSSPITGGGTSGAVTISIQDGTTAQKGAVQLENSTSSTSTTTAAVPASVKSAYDLANAAIPKSLVDAAGDLIYATANDTPARLAIGTAGQVLKVNSGATAPEWGAAGGASGLTLVKQQTIGSAVSSVTVTGAFSATYDNYLIQVNGGVASAGVDAALLTLGSTTTGYYLSGYYMTYSSATVNGFNVNNGASFNACYATSAGISGRIFLQNPFLSDETTFQSTLIQVLTGGVQANYTGFLNNTTSYTAFTLTANSGGNLTGGEIRVYGFQNS
jgi:hypothetical protein